MEQLNKQEGPCDENHNQGCDWVSEDWFDEDGNDAGWTSYCFNCYRYRDWGKDEYKKENNAYL